MKKTFFHHTKSSLNKGFTLVETLLAVLILAGCIAALTELVSSGFFSVRYAKNQIIATTSGSMTFRELWVSMGHLGWCI